MVARELKYTESLDSIHEELLYSHARLEVDEATREYANAFGELLVNAYDVKTQQQQNWDNEVRAQAAVDYWDEQLDTFVDTLANDLLHLHKQNRDHPRFARYFKNAPHAVRRMALEAELAEVATWAESLAGEPEDILKAHSETLKKLVESGQKAVNTRTETQGKTQNQRVQGINLFIDQCNQTRNRTHAALTLKGSDLGKPKTWADGFFLRKTVRSGKAEGKPENKTDTPTE